MPSDSSCAAADVQLRDEKAREQDYLDRAYRHLEAMSRRASEAAADAAERSAGDWNATIAHLHLTRRVDSLSGDTRPLCFGRIDEDETSMWYIGRRHVEDGAGEAVVVDWRAPVAVPFYRATFRDPLGLRLRRRFILEAGQQIVELLDEDFDNADTAQIAAASGLPDPLLAELGRSRTGTMHDIVATIAAGQDRIIRAPLDTPIVVQGGPGTGKTAVGLHRAAFLLFEHRVALERQGVLVLGPNRLFLAYISEVLPSLGEVAVVQTTLPGLAGAWRVRAEDTAAVARLKGDLRLAAVVERACRGGVLTPSGPIDAATRWGSVHLHSALVADLVESAVASGGSFSHRRLRFRRALIQRIAATLTERRPDVVIDADDIAEDLRQDRRAQRALDRLWPNQSAAGVVRFLLGRPATLAAAADGILSPEEQQLLRRRSASSVAAEAWTEADLPLLDEAHAQLVGPPRRFGHVVVDEAQDLSPMALRMVARRSADGRSLTILGDLAQATAPGATRDWAEAIDALGAPAGTLIEPLDIGYRVPRQIMDLANNFLADVAPHLPLTSSVRVTDDEPVFRRVPPDQVVVQAAAEAAALLRRFPSVALIAVPAHLAGIVDELHRRQVPTTPIGQPPAAGQISLLAPQQAKGLEFDAVIVVEPDNFLADAAGGGLLYIALTRAVQHLSVLHSASLPAALTAVPLSA